MVNANHTNRNIEDTIGCDGEMIHYEAVIASNNAGNYNESFMNACGDVEDDFYNAGGILKNFRKNQKIRQARRSERAKSKAQLRAAKGKAKIGKADAKKGLAKAQQMAAKASEKGVQADIATANALAATPVVETEKKGLSLAAKIGIGVGIAAVVGVGIYLVVKMVKKGKGGVKVAAK